MKHLPAGLLAQLDTVILQLRSERQFDLLNDPPEWFRTLWAVHSNQVEAGGISPFLDNFLVDAEAHWRKGESGPIKSGTFMETLVLEPPSDARSCPLEATALTLEGEHFLIIVNLGAAFEEQQSILQVARENLLTQEQLELEVVNRTRQIRTREAEVAGRLIYAAGFRDEETGAHIKRIGMYSAEMAKALNWSPLAVDDIQVAAPMHDIGKIGTPDRILKKPGKLTPDEFEVMKQHAQIGEEILSGSDIPMIQIAAEIAGNHHEYWNGSGYPRGIAGEAIPVSARIVAIVDVYDALVHKRVYKAAMPEDEAIAHMTTLVGQQFDPGLFEVFLNKLPAMREIRNVVRDN